MVHKVAVQARLMHVKLNNVHESVSYSDVVLWFQMLLLDVYTKVNFIHFKERDENFNGNEIPLDAGSPSHWGIHQRQGDG